MCVCACARVCACACFWPTSRSDLIGASATNPQGSVTPARAATLRALVPTTRDEDVAEICATSLVATALPCTLDLGMFAMPLRQATPTTLRKPRQAIFGDISVAQWGLYHKLISSVNQGRVACVPEA